MDRIRLPIWLRVVVVVGLVALTTGASPRLPLVRSAGDVVDRS
jgi:hypothetical protein